MHPTCLLYLYVFIFTIACALARRRSRFQREPLLCGDWARLCPIAILLLLARTDHTVKYSDHRDPIFNLRCSSVLRLLPPILSAESPSRTAKAAAAARFQNSSRE